MKEETNMHCTVKMTEDLYWVGASDRRLALFESVYPIPRGVSYNAYVLLDEKDRPARHGGPVRRRSIL